MQYPAKLPSHLSNNIYNITYIHVCIGGVYIASLTNWVILGVELVKTVKGVAILWEEPVEDASDDNI